MYNFFFNLRGGASTDSTIQQFGFLVERSRKLICNTGGGGGWRRQPRKCRINISLIHFNKVSYVKWRGRQKHVLFRRRNALARANKQWTNEQVIRRNDGEDEQSGFFLSDASVLVATVAGKRFGEKARRDAKERASERKALPVPGESRVH